MLVLPFLTICVANAEERYAATRFLITTGSSVLNQAEKPFASEVLHSDRLEAAFRRGESDHVPRGIGSQVNISRVREFLFNSNRAVRDLLELRAQRRHVIAPLAGCARECRGR
jgi:hypothetical protein